jgi:hypothetical protein
MADTNGTRPLTNVAALRSTMLLRTQQLCCIWFPYSNDHPQIMQQRWLLWLEQDNYTTLPENNILDLAESYVHLRSTYIGININTRKHLATTSSCNIHPVRPTRRLPEGYQKASRRLPEDFQEATRRLCLSRNYTTYHDMLTLIAATHPHHHGSCDTISPITRSTPTLGANLAGINFTKDT